MLAHPPGTIDGRFRVTEQGEMIAFNFGDAAVAERSLDIFTAAVLRDAFVHRPTPTAEWRVAMAEVRLIRPGRRRVRRRVVEERRESER